MILENMSVNIRRFKRKEGRSELDRLIPTSSRNQNASLNVVVPDQIKCSVFFGRKLYTVP